MDVTKEFKDFKSFVNWFIIASLSDIKITEQLKDDPKIITMQLNGVEINPLNAINRVQEEMNRMIEEKAEERIEGIKDDILRPFEEQVENLTYSLKKMIEERLNIK